jgi:hypothetical protein
MTTLQHASARPTFAATIVASVRYLVDADQKPVAYNPAPGTGEPWREGRYDDFPVIVRDVRPIAPTLSLDREGFVLVRRPSAVEDFYDEAEVRGTYYPEVVALIREATGASEVIVFDHTIRVGERAVERALRQPVQTVHNDYTERSAPRRVRDLVGEAAAEAWLAGRYAEYNVWRPIRGPVLSWPLGLVDAASIAPEDLVICDLVYPDRVGEIYHGAFNPAHRWYLAPRMDRDEAFIIKCFDSETDGRARFSLHAAFDDPTAPEDAPPRESIEVRAFARF